MGGRSTGALSWEDRMLVFTGNLSLANGGGFSSMLSPRLAEPAPTWSAHDGMTIEVIGDGRPYVMQARTSGERGGWIQRFETTEGAETTIALPWSQFEPVDRFLDPVERTGQLDPTDIEAVAIYILDKQEGPFRLAVRTIG